jgi:hypothetical protein
MTGKEGGIGSNPKLELNKRYTYAKFLTKILSVTNLTSGASFPYA